MKISLDSPAQIKPKIFKRQPQTIYSRFHPNRFTFGGVIADHVNTVETRPKSVPIFGLALSRIIKITPVYNNPSRLNLILN